jgi:hypothetical protein
LGGNRQRPARRESGWSCSSNCAILLEPVVVDEPGAVALNDTQNGRELLWPAMGVAKRDGLCGNGCARGSVYGGVTHIALHRPPGRRRRTTLFQVPYAISDRCAHDPVVIMGDVELSSTAGLGVRVRLEAGEPLRGELAVPRLPIPHRTSTHAHRGICGRLNCPVGPAKQGERPTAAATESNGQPFPNSRSGENSDYVAK